MTGRARLRGRRAALLFVAVILAASGHLTAVASSSKKKPASPVRTWKIRYRAHTGDLRLAYLVLPRWYGRKRHPRLPLVISPHGRGVGGRANARLWGALPARGPFVLVSPNGQGNRLPLLSWGAPGQVNDLARMPTILRRALPWLRIDRRRVYAFGGSMGGQETLLLLARHPSLLAGAAAFDSVTDLRQQYRRFRLIRCLKACLRRWKGPIGVGLQSLARLEVGGSPSQYPRRYAARSPATFARAIAASCVPLQLWWSRNDRIVRPTAQSARLLGEIRRRNRDAAVEAFVGTWRHTAEFRATSLLPFALARFGLLPRDSGRRPAGASRVDPPKKECRPSRAHHR